MSIPVRLSERVRRCGPAPISYLMQQAVANPHLISLAAGLVDQASLPAPEVLESAQRVLSDPVRGRAALQYGTTNGDFRLREQLMNHLAHLEGRSTASLGLTPERFILGTGSQQLLYLVGEVLLDPGDIVILGVPAYFVFLGVLESLGARVLAVPTDDHGLIPEAVQEALVHCENNGDLSRVKLIYDVSYFNNPTGVTLSADRREPLVSLARKWSREQRIHIIEDAAYRELRYAGNDYPSMLQYDPEGDTVLYAATFSKPFSPGMKTGYLVTPRPLVSAFLTQKGHHDFGSANLLHYLLGDVLASGAYQRHLQILRDLYRKKLTITLDTLACTLAPIADRVTWTRPEGGLYVWLTLPGAISTGQQSELFHRCLKAGVLYVPGEFCYPAGTASVRHDGIRLSFGVLDEAALREGIHRLASVLVPMVQNLPT